MATKLTRIEDIPQILCEMSVEEKAKLVTGRSAFTTQDFEKYGIPSCRVLDGGTGVNLLQYYGDVLAQALCKGGRETKAALSGISNSVMVMHILDKLESGEPLSEKDQAAKQIIDEEMQKIVPGGQMPGCFPPGMMLGATWDPETVHLCAQAVAKEMDVYQVDMVLGSPNVNIHRDPKNGRVFEGYSEDPCLTAKLAPEFVKGIQEEGLIANVKHFAANNQETHRQNVNELIPERALQEIYFPGFRACVQDGNVKSVMSAYNKINGTACALNRWLLTDVLRNDWGYRGMVISDWGAVYDQEKALQAGNDLDMPGPRGIGPIVQAVENGTLSMEMLDLAAGNVLKMLLDMPVMKGRRNTKIDRDFSREAAYRVAAEGCVLLKNQNGLLPLSDKTSISFVGPHSERFLESGGGSAVVYTDQYTSLTKSAAAIAGEARIHCGTVDPRSDAVVITVSAWGQEGNDRPAMDIDEADRAVLAAALSETKRNHQKVILILNVAGPVDMSDYLDDVDAILCVFLPGQEGGRVAADILFGRVNPSGKLPITFPKHYQDCPTYGNFPGCAAEVCYGEGIFVGYRYYEYKNIKPLYPFGFGLSYSNFRIWDLKLDRNVLHMEQKEKLAVSVRVKNLSRIDGKEVVQLYLHDPKSTLVKPYKELKAFRKVFLRAGEEKTVRFEIETRDLESYDNEWKQWVAEAGTYCVMVGNSSDAITAKASFVAIGKTVYNYSAQTMLSVLHEDERALELLRTGMIELGIDPVDLEDCLYFFPQRALGVVLHQLAKNIPGLSERECEVWCGNMLAKLRELDLSVLG